MKNDLRLLACIRREMLGVSSASVDEDGLLSTTSALAKAELRYTLVLGDTPTSCHELSKQKHPPDFVREEKSPSGALFPSVNGYTLMSVHYSHLNSSG